MKTLLSAVLLTTTLFGFADTTAKQNNFTLKPDQDTISINVGETATFAITITALNGFDASIFLALNPGSPQMLSSTTALTNSIINAPYTGVKFTVTTSKIFTKGGVYSFHITGTNDESFPSTATCYVHVIPDARSQWRFVKNADPLVNLIPKFIFQDAEGYYWYQTQKQDKDTPFEQWGYGRNPSYGESYIRPVINHKNNKVWLATPSSGVYRYTVEGTNKTVYYTSNSSLPDNRVFALAMDSLKGDIWAGTKKGLARFEGTDWVVLNAGNTNSVMGNEIISSIVVSGSIMWIGTSKGLVKYDGKEWKRFTPQNSGMPAPFARVFAVEANGDVWMGLSNDPTDDGIGENGSMIGIAKFDGTNWTLFDNKTAPLGKSNYVNSIAIDSKGNKWIATIGHLYTYGGTGILKYDNTSWTSYNTENSPLPSNEINWVGVDNDDNVWFHQLISNHGVSGFWGVFNENGLPPFLAPPTGVDEQPAPTDGITIFPNPTSTTFTISGADNILSVKILNSLGMEISRKSLVVSGKSLVVSGSVEVDVEDLASGVYFVQVRTATGMIMKSIVVSR